MRHISPFATSFRPVTLLAAGAIICALLASVTTHAQSVNGRVEGTVRDAAAAVVSNAAVTITNLQTGATRNATTNDEGVFAIPEVSPGPYNVRIEASSFKTASIPNVAVEVGTPATLTVELEAGEVSEVVTVDASAAQDVVNTTNAEIGDVVERRRVLDLPLDGRNPLDLITLQAGASDTGRVNGVRARGINITVNGINASDNFNKSEDNIIDNPTIPVSVESVREFRVTTGLATAEFGRGSAQVNVISQSGTNRFSGSLFEFHRNTALNANNFFNNRQGLPRETLIRNQFGGRIGGPVLIPKLYDGRDQTFFFFSYEGTRLAASETVNRLVYTEPARRGDFRYLNGLVTTPTNVANNPNAVRAAANLLTLRPGFNTADPTTAALIARTPVPNNFDLGDGLNTGGFRFNARRAAPKDIYSFRLDHRFSDKYSFELNYAYGNDFQLGDVVNSRLQLFPGEFGTDRILRGRGFSTALLAALSPTLVNEFRFGFQNASTDFINQSFGATPAIVVLNTVTSPFYTNANNGRQTPVYQFIDNLTHTRGNHLIKTGFDIRLLRGRRYNFAGTIPTVDLSITDNNPGLATSNFPGIVNSSSAAAASVNFANSLLNNLTGAIRRVSQTFNAAERDAGFIRDQPLRREYRTEEFDFYVQDSWKVRPNLTLNLGLRYEYSTVPREANNLISLPVGGVFGPTAPENLFVPGGTLGARTMNDLVPEDFQFFKNDRNNFAPVVSFAYSPFGDGKT
ncbi:MAG: carboxypeptidase regulatory-like domain-containing protein, partial [Pyrinomonadaceae bacterium]